MWDGWCLCAHTVCLGDLGASPEVFAVHDNVCQAHSIHWCTFATRTLAKVLNGKRLLLQRDSWRTRGLGE